jgi:hypothetical protein
MGCELNREEVRSKLNAGSSSVAARGGVPALFYVEFQREC